MRIENSIDIHLFLENNSINIEKVHCEEGMIISQHYIKKCENIAAMGFKPSTLCVRTDSRGKETTALAKSSSSGRCLRTYLYLNREKQIKSKLEKPLQTQSTHHTISLLTVMCTQVYI